MPDKPTNTTDRKRFEWRREDDWLVRDSVEAAAYRGGMEDAERRIVEWLRTEAATYQQRLDNGIGGPSEDKLRWAHDMVADAIERGEHRG